MNLHPDGKRAHLKLLKAKQQRELLSAKINPELSENERKSLVLELQAKHIAELKDVRNKMF